MTFEDLKLKYPERGPAFPEDWEKPTREHLSFIMETYGCQYPKSFIDFQLQYCHRVPMGDFAWDDFGWASPTAEPYWSLEEVVKDYQEIGFPGYLAPFRQDNGDFWCFDTRKPDPQGEFPVVIWDHNADSIEKDPAYQWKNFIEWLDQTMEE